MNKKLSLCKKIRNWIDWRLFRFRYEKKMTKVLEFIRTAKGEKTFCKLDKKEKTCQVSSGMQNIITYIFSAGDCARFAKLLVLAFPKYRPKILLVKYRAKAGSKSLWHHAIVDFGGFYADIDGVWLKETAKVRFVLEKAYHVKRLDAPVLKGEMSYLKFIDGLFHKIPGYDFMLTKLDTEKPELLGVHKDKIGALSRMYEKQNDPHFLEYLQEVETSFLQYEHGNIPGLVQ